MKLASSTLYGVFSNNRRQQESTGAKYQVPNTRCHSGFTLIELMLYIGVSSVIFAGVSIFIVQMVQTREKQRTIAEVEQQGLQVMQRISQTIRNAEGINSPAQGASGSSLSVDVISVPDDPTVFDLSSGTLRITEGAGTTTDLISSAIVTASSLNFENLSRNNTPGTVKIEFTLTRTNPSGRNEYDYSKTFRGSASLR